MSIFIYLKFKCIGSPDSSPTYGWTQEKEIQMGILWNFLVFPYISFSFFKINTTREWSPEEHWRYIDDNVHIYLHYNFMRNHNIPIFIGKKNRRYWEKSQTWAVVSSKNYVLNSCIPRIQNNFQQHAQIYLIMNALRKVKSRVHHGQMYQR